MKNIFLQKDQREWCQIFEGTDACVAPVLDLEEAPKHPHNVSQNTFIKMNGNGYSPNPCPVLSRTPGVSQATQKAPKCGEHTRIVLCEIGYTEDFIQILENQGTISNFTPSKL